MGDGLQAALRLRPDQERLIETLFRRDDDFRTLCEDLAEAEEALLRWNASMLPHGEERRAEYRKLVEGLAKEVQSALQAAAVVPFGHPRRR